MQPTGERDPQALIPPGSRRETPPEEPKAPVLNFDKLFRTALVVIPIGVLGNILFSLYATDREVLASLHAFPRGYLLLAVFLGLVPWLTNSLRLWMWTRFLGHDLSLRDAFQMILATDLGAAASPTAVGGGLFKWGMLVQRGVTPGAAASIITLPNVEDALFFLFAIPLAVYLSEAWELPIFRQIGAEVRTDAGILLAVVFVLLFLVWVGMRMILRGDFGERVREKGLRWFGRARRRLRIALRDAVDVFRVILRRGKSRFALAMVLTAIQWISRYSVITALAIFLGASVDPVLFFLLQWVLFGLMTLIPTPGAVGGAEAMFYFIYGALLPERVIGLATAGWRFLTFYLQLALAAIIFTTLNLRAGRPRGPSV